MATSEEAQALRDELALQVGHNGISAVGLEKDPNGDGVVVGISVDDEQTEKRIQSELSGQPVSVHVTGAFYRQ